ncbi:hypothetical protein PS706_03312 [Pseudomonas fluorescens]|nr:hypothetical protein PS706_03312 [Pseudomonas fluorescens]
MLSVRATMLPLEYSPVWPPHTPPLQAPILIPWLITLPTLGALITLSRPLDTASVLATW